MKRRQTKAVWTVPAAIAGHRPMADRVKDEAGFGPGTAAPVTPLSPRRAGSARRSNQVPLPRIVAFSASAARPARTRALVEALAAELAARRPIDLTVYDLVDAGAGLAVAARTDLPPAARALVEAIESADALIVGTPVYQGSYAGLFKHVFDFVRPETMLAKPVALTATGGGLRHALVVEHALRPLFGFFAAHVVPTAVYAASAEMDGPLVADPALAARLRAAGGELSDLVGLARASRAPMLRAAG